jgi:hypothetical protein
VRLESTVNLLVATLDLKLVQLVRGAMNAADAQGVGPCGRLIHPAPVIEPRRRFHPEPVFEPRPHVHPEPAFDPRPRLHVPDFLRGGTPAPCDPSATPAEPAGRVSSASPIEPPWKVLPWENPPAPRPRPLQKIKIVNGRPDISSKGNVIDLFI